MAEAGQNPTFRQPPNLSQDEAVMSTNDDATTSKKYAIALGYWKDPYVSLFCKLMTKKTPEISRGYFARVNAVRRFLTRFVQMHSGRCQVLSLGAGYDTTFWCLQDAEMAPHLYVEIDFPAVTRQKTHILYGRNKQQLLGKLTGDIDVVGSKMGLVSSSYCLLPGDLRKFDELWQQLEKNKFDPALPTLVLAECVFMYMPPPDVDKLLSMLSTKLKAGVFLNYDVINMTDRFAEVMLSNLGGRQCTLHTQDCASKISLISRFERTGWTSCTVYDMNEIYTGFPKEERTRVEKLEFLDEVHLFSELMNHYCICIASCGQTEVQPDLSALTIT